MLANAKYILFDAVAPALLNQQQQGAMPWWVWFLMIVVVIVLFALLWRRTGLSKGGEQPEKSYLIGSVTQAKPVTTAAPAPEGSAAPIAKQPKPEASAAPASAPVANAEAAFVEKKPKTDDLTLIEGIGPKIATVLLGVGIKTFAQLANTEAVMLDATLKAANMRLADPESWPEQAKLAAEGKFDELKVLQDNLKGGRRV